MNLTRGASQEDSTAELTRRVERLIADHEKLIADREKLVAEEDSSVSRSSKRAKIAKVEGVQVGECFYTEGKHLNQVYFNVVTALRGKKQVKVKRVARAGGKYVVPKKERGEWCTFDDKEYVMNIASLDGRVEDLMVWAWHDDGGSPSTYPTGLTMKQLELAGRL